MNKDDFFIQLTDLKNKLEAFPNKIEKTLYNGRTLFGLRITDDYYQICYDTNGRFDYIYFGGNLVDDNSTLFSFELDQYGLDVSKINQMLGMERIIVWESF